mmetsp:Transcript_48817/g.139694  ORF Transcript_48817/g.139694 Transcript_48817/m.139694 type:complete len:94 (+) Transcript_48817:435-716(+)
MVRGETILTADCTLYLKPMDFSKKLWFSMMVVYVTELVLPASDVECAADVCCILRPPTIVSREMVSKIAWMTHRSPNMNRQYWDICKQRLETM